MSQGELAPELTLANLPEPKASPPQSMPLEITSATSSPESSPPRSPIGPRKTSQNTQRAHSTSSSDIDDVDAGSDKSTSVSSPVTDDFICFNEHEPWSHSDLKTLYHLFRYGIPLQSVSRHLGRSFASSSLALKKIVTQQIVRHSIQEVAKHYDMRIDEVRGWVKCEKYYVPLENEAMVTDTATSTYRNTWAVPAFILGYMIMLCCVSMYGRIVVIEDGL